MNIFKILINLFSIKKQTISDSNRLVWLSKLSKVGTIEINKPSHRRNFELIFYSSNISNTSFSFLGNNLQKVIDVAMKDTSLNSLIDDHNSLDYFPSNKHNAEVFDFPIKPAVGDIIYMTNCNEVKTAKFKD